jgi:hypothetical protein
VSVFYFFVKFNLDLIFGFVVFVYFEVLFRLDQFLEKFSKKYSNQFFTRKNQRFQKKNNHQECGLVPNRKLLVRLQ